jgi:hypothetical protein
MEFFINSLSSHIWIEVFSTISRDLDIIAKFQDSFHHFIDSGQVWALFIGLVLGYIFRSFTSY